MLDSYDGLKRVFPEKLEEVNRVLEALEKKGLKNLDPVRDGLKKAESLSGEADKKYYEGNEEEAFQKIREAYNLAGNLLCDLWELNFRYLLKRVRDIYEFSRKHKELAHKNIDGYDGYVDQFLKIEGDINSFDSSGKRPSFIFINKHEGELRSFLEVYGRVEEDFRRDIRKERKAKILKAIGTILLALISGGVIGWISDGIKWLSNHFFGK